MNEVGWAYWLKDHWHLCREEPKAHSPRQRVFLEEDVMRLVSEREQDIAQLMRYVRGEGDRIGAEFEERAVEEKFGVPPRPGTVRASLRPRKRPGDVR